MQQKLLKRLSQNVMFAELVEVLALSKKQYTKNDCLKSRMPTGLCCCALINQNFRSSLTNLWTLFIPNVSKKCMQSYVKVQKAQ